MVCPCVPGLSVCLLPLATTVSASPSSLVVHKCPPVPFPQYTLQVICRSSHPVPHRSASQRRKVSSSPRRVRHLESCVLDTFQRQRRIIRLVSHSVPTRHLHLHSRPRWSVSVQDHPKCEPTSPVSLRLVLPRLLTFFLHLTTDPHHPLSHYLSHPIPHPLVQLLVFHHLIYSLSRFFIFFFLSHPLSTTPIHIPPRYPSSGKGELPSNPDRASLVHRAYPLSS